jgi:hypothetical protein
MNINLHQITEIVEPKGIVHIGASSFQELELYKSLGFDNRVWIEGNSDIPNDNGEICYYGYVGRTKEIKETWIANNNGESSSLLKPLLHINEYPEIEFSKGKLVEVMPTSYYLDLISINEFNYLLLDIQGMELEALKGLGIYIYHFQIIITECYLAELYLNCGKLSEIQDYLINYELLEFKQEIGKSWGDAVFIKKLV